MVFENGVRGGLVTKLDTKTELNDPNLPGYNPSKPRTTAGMVNVNILYPMIMVKKLLVGKATKLNKVELDGFMKNIKYL